ncbi:hypothetical protein ACSBOX_05790 [Arthrobacter sp. KN11-1C]|uniref:hypothetical protein n=1 Tax=Arthrobacter sp. KN11-1C TaxID=3445774 RepID=UPI003FA0E3CF
MPERERVRGRVSRDASGSGVMSKRLVDKIAAAKVYEAAMKEACGELPASVRRLARRDH